MKGISIITKGKNTCNALVKQLEYFLGERVSIKGYYIDGNIHTPIKDDLVVISSTIIYKDALPYIDNGSHVIVARRSVNYHEIYKLFAISSGTDVLLVNDLEPTTHETILELKALGLDHINYFPYYPSITKDLKKYVTAVTPGELELVPDYVNRVIDIGSRNIDFTTMVEIFKALDISDERIKLLSAKYVKDIIDLIKKTQEMAHKNNLISNQLKTIINAVHDGIVALNEKGVVTVFNSIAEDLFRCRKEEIIGKSIEDLSSEGNISSTLTNIEKESIVNIDEKYVVLNCTPIEGNNATGTVYTLKDVTEIQRLEEELRRKLLNEEKYARYTFDDIAGNSEAIINTKNLAKRLARSPSSILIQGESGTGKELFAQAIHNMSPRKKGPFVAINFAALPESLLESELFGYEEGAFTGAKKGGKPGLFEQAHGGTVFLDEIGDAPIYFQVRLLRVLQEKQVQRIGGLKIIPIDIRVISATNRDLRVLIEKNMFRRDLYYRLNVLPLKIPSLRERRKDILILAQTFYIECLQERPPVKPQEYFKHIRNNLLTYDWPGNIRELYNIVEYLANISPNRPPAPELLPEELQAMESLTTGTSFEYSGLEKILGLIEQANTQGEPVGRRSLAKKTGLPESRVRRFINQMSNEGFIEVRRGFKGLLLTKKGESMLIR